MKKDTIAAISTAVSESGIGIIRISGEEAFEVADRVWQSPGKKKRLSMLTYHVPPKVSQTVFGWCLVQMQSLTSRCSDIFSVSRRQLRKSNSQSHQV